MSHSSSVSFCEQELWTDERPAKKEKLRTDQLPAKKEEEGAEWRLHDDSQEGDADSDSDFPVEELRTKEMRKMRK